MKKTLNTILLLLVIGTAMATPRQTMEAANKAYEAKDYATAAEQYESVLSQGLSSTELLYNLGNAYFRMGDYAKATLNYERALRLSPNDTEIKENLELTQSRTLDNIEPLPEFFLARWYNAFLGIASTTGWKIVTLILVALLLAAVVTLVLSSAYTARKWCLMASMILAGLVVVSGINTIVSGSRMNDKDEAIVMPTMISVKSSPEEGSVEKFVLHSGTKVEITDEVNDWLKISIADGNKGWLRTNEIEKI